MLHSVKNILKLGQKFIIIFSIFYLILHVFAYFLFVDKETVQKDPTVEKRKELYDFVYDPELQKTDQGKFASDAMQWISCSLVGEACGETAVESEKVYQERYHTSLIGRITNLIVVPYANPPASGLAWTQSGLAQAGFVPDTYAAQGIGFSAIQPLSNIWKMFRDFVLLLMVLVIVAIGFMIMFRAKLDSQTVIKIETSLPKIILTLILIVFSFPIAGFMIDLMYISIGLIISLFATNGSFAAEYDYQNLYDRIFIYDNLGFMEGTLQGSNPFDDVWNISKSIYYILPDFLQFVVGAIGYNVAFFLLIPIARKKFPFLSVLSVVHNVSEKIKNSGTFVASLIAAFVSLIIELVMINLLGWFLGIVLLFVIILVSLLVVIFRIFFMLLFAYIKIILFIIFAPLILLLNAVPGQNMFSVWLKGLFFNLLTFPMVIMLTLVSQVIMSIPETQQALWRPPFLYSIGADSFKVLLAGLILFSTPNIVASFKQILGDQPQNFGISPMNFGAGAIAGVGAVTAPLAQFGSAGAGIAAVQKMFNKDGPPVASSPEAVTKATQELGDPNAGLPKMKVGGTPGN
jgi:hypothetical protein